jgi:serine/threonine protein kinase
MSNSSDDLGRLHGLAHAEVLPGHIGRYEILSLLGQGGMGKVYKAFDPHLERAVALKVLTPDDSVNAASNQKALLKEAQLAAKLRHANVVQVYEVVQDGSPPYIAMEYVEGCSLAQYLKEQRPTPQWSLEIIRKVAIAIHHAHHEGIIHRDLKPANIMLCEQNEPKVTDFGLAKMLNTDTSISSYGMVIGTPSYIPPEQIRGDVYHIDQRSDVYGLGATLYEMLTGKPPFHADTIVQIALEVLQQEPVRPSLESAVISREVDAICLKCLEKNPRKRYQSAAALAQDIEHYQKAEPVSSYSFSPLYRLSKWLYRCGRIVPWSGLLVILFLLSLTGNALLYHRMQQHRMRLASSVVEPQRKTADTQPNTRTISPSLVASTLDKTLRENGTYTLFVRDMARAMHERKIYSETQEKWRVMQQLIGENGVLYRLWGQCLFLHGLRESDAKKRHELWREALSHTRRAFTLSANDAHALYLTWQLGQKIYGESADSECRQEYQTLSGLQTQAYSHYLAAEKLWRNTSLATNEKESEASIAKGLNYCDAGLVLNPEMPDLYEMKARILLRAGRLQEAMESSKQSLEKGYGMPARLALRPAEKGQVDWEKVGAHLLPHPRYSEFIALQGEIIASQKDFVAAAEVYQRAIQESPGNTELYYKRGYCYNVQKKHVEAVSDLSKALEGQNSLNESYLLRSDSYLSLKQYQLALRDAEVLVSCYPLQHVSYVARMRVYQELGRYQDALEDIDKALQLSSDNHKLYLLRANLYSLLQQPEKTMQDLKTAVKLQK